MLASWHDERDSTPLASSQILTRNHLVATTLRGEVIVIGLGAQRADNAKAFRFQTPNRKGIGSTPAVVGGRIYFGCDDGYFYVLGPDGKQQPSRVDEPDVHKARAPAPEGPNASDWPSTYGNPGNTSFLDDPTIKPPLRVRWASRGFGHQLAPSVTADGDLLTVTLARPGHLPRSRRPAACAGEPRCLENNGPRHQACLSRAGACSCRDRPTAALAGAFIYCLSQTNGRLIWSADIGGRYIWERAAPVMAAGVVAFGSGARGDSGNVGSRPGTPPTANPRGRSS